MSADCTDRLLSTSEAAEFLGVSISAIRSWLADGSTGLSDIALRFPPNRARGRIRFSMAELLEWAGAGGRGAAA